MADVTLSYKGSDILELSDSGSATLKTGGKYCEDDVTVAYVKPSGGGSVWELIAESTTENVATINIAEIPSAYQNENVYKVEVTAEFSATEYPYFLLNEISAGYTGSRTANKLWKFVGYVIKCETDSISKPYAIYIGDVVKLFNDATTLESVCIKGYYENRIKEGCNIKVWRLVE